MKQSDIYSINRAAESGQINADEYANLHEQIANDKLNGKLTKAEAEDINNWLNEQTKDLPEDIEFINADGVQKAHYFNELKQISQHHDKQTAYNLDKLSEKQATRAEAISIHVESQRKALSQAIVQREAAKQEYFKKRDELKSLQDKYVDIHNKSEQLRVVVDEKREELKSLSADGKNASNSIKEHFAKHDNFDIKAEIHISAPDYALRKARAFAQNQQQLNNAAADQQDPDVRMRIEIEQFRRESAFRRDQNINIEALTGTSRANEIEMHEQNESMAAIQAAQLELKLEAKGIKVDFSTNEVEVRTIEPQERVAAEMQKNLEAIKLKSDLESALDSDTKAQRAIDHELNATGRVMDQKATEVAVARNQLKYKDDEVLDRKSALTDRLKQNRERAMVINSSGALSSRQSAMLAEARTNQVQAAKNANLQQQQELRNAQHR